MRLDPRRAVAAAGIGYVVLVGIENIDVLGAPGVSSPVEEIARVYSDDRAQLVVTTVCGSLALLCYLVFVVGIWRLLRAREAPGERWSTLGLVGGVGGIVLAAVGQIAHITLVVRGADGVARDADLTRSLYELDLRAQAIAGFLVCLFVLGMGMAGLRTGAMPAWLAWPAIVLAPLLLAAAIAGTASDDARAAVVTAFGLETVWVLVASIWLLLDGWEPARHDRPSMLLARVMFGAVGVAAGISGIALIAAPSATSDYFAWGLAPVPLASLIGGFYIASSVVYLQAARAGWLQGRPLVVGILALSIPIFVATMVDLHLFDFGRLPAWVWVVLFGLFPLAAIAVLLGQRGAATPEADRRLSPGVRAGLLAIAALLLAAAIALWADPTGADAYLPFTPPSLSGRVLGGWAFLLAVLAAWAALRDRAREAGPALLALVAFPIGALIAASRSFGDLDPDGRALYVAVLIAWTVAALALAGATFRTPTRHPTT